MGTMNAFLKWATSGEAREVYRAVGAKFDKWIVDTNDALKKGVPTHRGAQPHHGVDHHLQPARAVPLDVPVLPKGRGVSRFPGSARGGF